MTPEEMAIVEQLRTDVDRLRAENERLIAEITQWWDERQYDTTGEYGEWNVYHETPPFVELALKSKPNAEDPRR